VNYKRLVTAAAELFDRLSAAWWIPALLMRLFVGTSSWRPDGPRFTTSTHSRPGSRDGAFLTARSTPHVRLHGVPRRRALNDPWVGMRFVSIPMIINMIVAILTVKLKNVGGLDDFAELDETALCAEFSSGCSFSGAGWLSMDVLSSQLSGHGYNKTNRRARLKFLMTRPAWLKILTYSLNTIVH